MFDTYRNGSVVTELHQSAPRRPESRGPGPQKPGPQNVVVALGRPSMVEVARAFAAAGFAPVVAFDADQIAALAVTADIVIADDTIDPGGRTLRDAGGVGTPVKVFVADSHRDVPAEIHAVIPPDLAPGEVLARTRTLLDLRGVRPDAERLEWGPLRLDLARRLATWHGEPCALTQTQLEILAALVRAGGAVVSKPDLQKAVWPDEPPDAGERLVAHIRRIRRRIEDDPAHPEFLLTSRGMGFRLGTPDAAPDAAFE